MERAPTWEGIRRKTGVKKLAAYNVTPQSAGADKGLDVQASLAAAVRRQLKPHWKAPTGADVEQLRTELSIRLAKDGSVTDVGPVKVPSLPIH